MSENQELDSPLTGVRIYVDEAFFPRSQCDRIRRAMTAGSAEEAEILNTSIQRQDDVRRAVSIEPEAAVVLEVERWLDGRRDAIGDFFGLALGAREGCGFLRYPAGGFYGAHRDRAEVPSWPDAARRLIAVVLFLNASRDVEPEGEFSGGTLRLFEGSRVVDILPRTGTLVAFAADVLHEVTEVRGGTRDAIVDWFYAP